MSILHGVYGVYEGQAVEETRQYGKVPVYVGTAPVHNVMGGARNVNTPVLVGNFTKAKALFGYSDNWAQYTLCEAMHAHFKLLKTGPIILINVLDAAHHKDTEEGTKSATPTGGKIVLSDMQDAVLDTIAITGKTADLYTVSYDDVTGKVTITEKATGGLGSASLSITYTVIAPEMVEDEDIIGAYDGEGVSTGMQALRNVYQLTGQVPGTLLCPGFSHVKTVRDAMAEATLKINGHFDNFFYTDIPLSEGESGMTLSGAAAWKDTNGYTAENEKVHYPKWKGADGKIYHRSVLYAAQKQLLTAAAGGVPFETASNTAMPAGSPYYGEGRENFLPDEESLNKHLVANGITTSAFVGGEWRHWGAHTAAYDAQADEPGMSLSETNLEMVQYILNRFQVVYVPEVDKPTTRNRLESIAAAENAYLDGLKSTGKILYGKCRVVITREDSDAMRNGDFEFAYEVTTTLLSKSLTARLVYTPAGLDSIFEEVA